MTDSAAATGAPQLRVLGGRITPMRQQLASPPHYKPLTGHPADWSFEQCGQWIHEAGFPEYQEAFVTNVNGRQFVRLSNVALTKLGIGKVAHQKMVMDAFRETMAAVEGAPPVEEENGEDAF